MDYLPDHLVLEILNRLNDSTELTRCKLVSKTLNALAPRVPSIYLHCSSERYAKMRSPETGSKMTSLKTIFYKLIAEAQVPIESLSLRVDKSVAIPLSSHYGFNDDLFLTIGPFSDDWLSKIGGGLKSISVVDFDIQSCGRGTNILEMISYHCHTLAELALERAWLSFDGIHLMPLLTRLTLSNVPMNDDELNQLMECLPCLEVFNLIDSCEGTDPKIFHLNLRELKWTLNNCPMNDTVTITVIAPELTKLELECQYLVIVMICAPLVSYFYFALESCDVFKEDLKTLKTLSLVSSDLYSILSIFPSNTKVWNLTLDSPGCVRRDETGKFSLSKILESFPYVTSLTLGSGVWSQQMVYPLAPLAKGSRASCRINGLKQITLYFLQGDFDRALCFISFVVRICENLSDIVLFIDRDIDLSVAISYVASCMSQCSKVRWRWGTWKRGWNDCISDSIVSYANTV